MMEPLTREKMLKHPILYREAPNVREHDIMVALNGLKQDVRAMTELDADVLKLILYNIDTWFPAFMKE